MSVAFRRDSDEEHLEPRFELPIPAGRNLVTARGLRLTHARVAEIEAAVAATDDAAERAGLERDLRYWKTRQVTAELAPPPAADVVGFGSAVRFTLNGRPRTLRIVGDDEAAPADGLVSFNAPLSRALLGAEVGDLLPFAGADDAIEILEIAVPESLEPVWKLAGERVSKRHRPAPPPDLHPGYSVGGRVGERAGAAKCAFSAFPNEL